VFSATGGDGHRDSVDDEFAAPSSAATTTRNESPRLSRVQFTAAPLEGAWVIDLERHADNRGSFARTFCAHEFADRGLPADFPQANLSTNTRAGTLRGMHFNREPDGEAKLVRCVAGALYDVIVDLRRGSPTRLSWYGVELSAENGRALYVPAGFAHGFVTLADESHAYYHMSDFFRPDAARGIRWDDPAVSIDWPTHPVVMSERDRTYPDIDPPTFDPARWEH
jgi:dTDP-4-dehydrorhamnose 3,5-epimerase